jgi:hypothetical protein
MREAAVKFERKRVTISNGRYYYIQDLQERRRAASRNRSGTRLHA